MADNVVVQFTVDDKGSRALEKIAESLDKTGKEAKKTEKSFSTFFQTLGGFVGAQAIIGGVRRLGAGLQSAAGDALEFSAALAEINSILPENQRLTTQTKNTFLEFSSTFGGSAQKQAKAFYSIVSAGVQTTAKQLEVLEVANRAAVAGLVDIDTSAKVLVSSVNSYAQSGLTAQEASDALFVAVREGQTTFTELASAIGRVAPLASAANITFDELTGTLAFITKAGVSTAEAVTQLRGIINSVIKPSEDAKRAAAEFGIELSTRGIKAAGGFAEFLDRIRVATGGSDKALGRLFPSVEALSGVINITTGNFEEFERILSQTATAGGATEAAFKVIESSAAFQFEGLIQQLKNLPQSFLVNFEQPIADAIKSIREFVGGQGILLIADAVELAVDAFAFFRSGIDAVQSRIGSFRSFIIDAQIALEEFSVVQTEQSKKRVQELRKEQEEIFKSEFTRRKEFDESIKKIADFRAKVAEGRRKQADAVKTTNKDIRDSDRKRFNEQITGADDVFNARQKLIEQGKALAVAGLDFTSLLKLRNDELKASFDQGLLDFEEFITQREELAAQQLQNDFKAIDAANLKEDEAEAARIAAVRKFNLNNAKLRKERSDFETKQDKLDLKARDQALSNLASLSSSSNKTLFRISQVAAIAQASINQITGISNALAGPPTGPTFPLNLALAVTQGIALGARISQIASAKPPGLQAGIDSVPGTGNADNFPALLAPGERVVPAESNRDLTAFLAQQDNTQVLLEQLVENTRVPVVLEANSEGLFNLVRDEIQDGRSLESA